MKSKVMLRPDKVEKIFPPGHYYPILDLTYDEWQIVIKKMRDSGTGSITRSLRPIVHDIYLYSNGEKTISEIVEKLEFTYNVRINPEHIVPIIEAMERFGSLKFMKKI
jgi:hypothetical protein